jgi:hypothetical protein
MQLEVQASPSAAPRSCGHHRASRRATTLSRRAFPRLLTLGLLALLLLHHFQELLDLAHRAMEGRFRTSRQRVLERAHLDVQTVRLHLGGELLEGQIVIEPVLGETRYLGKKTLGHKLIHKQNPLDTLTMSGWYVKQVWNVRQMRPFLVVVVQLWP